MIPTTGLEGVESSFADASSSAGCGNRKGRKVKSLPRIQMEAEGFALQTSSG
jgi:hypothetical protein